MKLQRLNLFEILGNKNQKCATSRVLNPELMSANCKLATAAKNQIFFIQDKLSTSNSLYLPEHVYGAHKSEINIL